MREILDKGNQKWIKDFFFFEEKKKLTSFLLIHIGLWWSVWIKCIFLRNSIEITFDHRKTADCPLSTLLGKYLFSPTKTFFETYHHNHGNDVSQTILLDALDSKRFCWNIHVIYHTSAEAEKYLMHVSDTIRIYHLNCMYSYSYFRSPARNGIDLMRSNCIRCLMLRPALMR